MRTLVESESVFWLSRPLTIIIYGRRFHDQRGKVPSAEIRTFSSTAQSVAILADACRHRGALLRHRKTRVAPLSRSQASHGRLGSERHQLGGVSVVRVPRVAGDCVRRFPAELSSGPILAHCLWYCSGEHPGSPKRCVPALAGGELRTCPGAAF